MKQRDGSFYWDHVRCFSFKERYELVKQGVNDINNVCVVPSGEYLISQKTFSEYFIKSQIVEAKDMDYDVRIFGELIAKELDVSVRFVGEEPFDPVTRKYNETMQRILPEYGLKVIEIPRVADSSGEIVSATKVRRYMQEKNVDGLKSMLPDTTLTYVLQKMKE